MDLQEIKTGSPVMNKEHIEVSEPLHEGQVPRQELVWSKIRAYCRDAFSEFCGVFILILFGVGSVAQVVLSHDVKGEYQSISWGWG